VDLKDIEKEIVNLVARDAVKIPPYPAVAFQIERLVSSGDYGLDDLARLVGSDQVVSADVLRVGNWFVYSRGKQVNSIKQAVTAIGAHDVGRIALASGLAGQGLAPGKLASMRRQIWIDALASAFLCQALAPRRDLAPDVAFSAGLLHDFGKVIAIACLEDLLSRRDDVGAHTAAEWQQVIEHFHVELGLVMAARWGLPQVIADAISLHHAASLPASDDPALVELIAVVDEVTALLRAGIALDPADLSRAKLLGTDDHLVVLRAVQTLPEFVASFETEEAWRPAPESLVSPEPKPRREGPPPPGVGAVLSLGGRRVECRFVGIAPTHCMLSAPSALPENLLLGLEIASDPAIKGFASVKLAWPEGDGVTMLVQPYALSKDTLRAWNALVDASTARATG
jgi:putative nucleotidyltransferase with HDIG domain